jgi:hypothetical protein
MTASRSSRSRRAVGALHKSAGFIRDWIVRGVGEWAERIVADVNTGGVDVVLSARRAILEIVAPSVLCHPRALYERLYRGIAVVLTESLPPVLLRIESKQPVRRPFVRETFRLIELDDVQWIQLPERAILAMDATTAFHCAPT